MVGLLKLVPGSSPANGFATEAERNALLAFIASVRELSRVQVLVRQRVDVLDDLDVVAVVADVRRLEHEPAGQLALGADLVAQLLRDLRVLVEEVDRLTEVLLAAVGVADRLEQRLCQQRVVPGTRDRRARGVRRRRDGGRLRPAGRDTRLRGAGRGSRRRDRRRRGSRSWGPTGTRSLRAAGTCSSACCRGGCRCRRRRTSGRRARSVAGRAPSGRGR